MGIKIVNFYLVIFFLLIPFSFSINYYNFEFKDANNVYVQDLVARGFLCSDIDCKNQFSSDLWDGQTKSTNADGTNYDIVLDFPSNSETNAPAMIVFYHNFNYLPKARLLSPRSQISGSSYTNPYLLPASLYIIKPINKASQCSSPVTLNVVNNVKENLPVTITTGASMSSTTKSAFGFNGNVYVGWIQGSQFQQYYEIETTLLLTIYKYDVAQQKNIGSPIQTQTVVKRIYYDSTASVSFDSWTPPDVGYYNVTVQSIVTDPKCSSNIPQSSSQIVNVWKSFPKDECYSLTRNLATTPPNPEVNQEVTITFEKLSNYANNYDAWDTNYHLSPTPTKIILNINGPTSGNTNTDLSANTDDDFKSAQIKWTPTLAGNYQLDVTARSTNYNCPKDTISNPLISTVTVSNIPSYDVTFTVQRSSDSSKINQATISLVNTQSSVASTNSTNSLGIRTLSLQRGSYTYTVTKTGYATATGTINVQQGSQQTVTLTGTSSCPDVNLDTDKNNCGACGNVCSFSNAISKCILGSCQIDTCSLNYYMSGFTTS